MIGPDTWFNPCGGMPYRTLGDGRIEIQGQGVPADAPDGAAFGHVQATWKNWRPQMEASAKRFGIPVAWILAIATNETGAWSSSAERQRTIASTDGFSSIGIMQPIPSTARLLGYTPEDRLDAQANLDMGAALMKRNLAASKNGGFPAIAAMYNAGHLCPTTSNVNAGNVDPVLRLPGYRGVYVRDAISHLNAAIQQLGLGGSGTSSMLYAAAGAGLVALAGIWVWRRS